ncbi:MAG: GGDEF domain-containing protein [Anaerolineales bacterium]|nr:GGDEF domain-containing protein [Anaerolineales bacterium]
MNSIPGNRKSIISMALIGAMVIIIAISDYFTGSDLEFGLFYLIPILFSATIHRTYALILVFVSASLSFLTDVAIAGYSSIGYGALWDFLSHIAIFSLVALLRSNLIQSNQMERQQARTDSLTGAANIRAFHEIANAEIHRSIRYKHPLTIAFLDIDNFKSVNDTLGHITGDKLLSTMVAVLQARLRDTDTVARLGGDEFAILLPETGQEDARPVISHTITQLTDELQKHNWNVTFSIGVLTCVDIPPTVEKMMKTVDALMYDVKHGGKDAVRYSVYSPRPGETESEN